MYDKINKASSKKFEDDVMLRNCDVIVIFLIYIQYGAFRKPKPSVKLTFSLKVTFYLTKTENRTRKCLAKLSTIALSKGTIFVKNADISKIR